MPAPVNTIDCQPSDQTLLPETAGAACSVCGRIRYLKRRGASRMCKSCASKMSRMLTCYKVYDGQSFSKWTVKSADICSSTVRCECGAVGQVRNRDLIRMKTTCCKSCSYKSRVKN